MSVITRTNRATNPNVAADATNWAYVAGTSGVGSGALNTGAGYDGGAGFWRSTWTTATTALSGGFSYLQVGLGASTQYTHSVYVRSSKAQAVRLSAQYQDSASVNVGAATDGPIVTLTANTWARISVTATSGAAVDRVILTAAATTGGSFWAVGDTFDGDCVLVETGSVLDTFFDGSYAAASSIVYAWTGTANASTSTATIYQPALALLNKTDAPCDRVEITITDMVPTESVYTLWRTADGKRQAVRGYRRVSFNTSDFALDYEAPIGRTIKYELEAYSGVAAGMPNSTASTTLGSATQDYGWIQDPLDPGSAVKVYGDIGPNGDISLMDESIKALEYAMDASIIAIMGSPDPVALLGQRMSQRGVPYKMSTDAAQMAADLRNLIMQASLLLIRPVPAWGAALPGLCYTAAGSINELPINEAWGGHLIEWTFAGDLVAAPTMNVLIPLWTYGDVQALWTTYQQAQTALAGKSYLAVKKSPSGA